MYLCVFIEKLHIWWVVYAEFMKYNDLEIFFFQNFFILSNIFLHVAYNGISITEKKITCDIMMGYIISN